MVYFTKLNPIFHGDDTYFKSESITDTCFLFSITFQVPYVVHYDCFFLQINQRDFSQIKNYRLNPLISKTSN